MSTKVNQILGKISSPKKETKLSSSKLVELGIKEAIAELRSEIDFIQGEEQDLVKQANKAKSQILKIAAGFLDSARTSNQAAEGSMEFVKSELVGFGANEVVIGVEAAYSSFEQEYDTLSRAMQGVENEAKQL